MGLYMEVLMLSIVLGFCFLSCIGLMILLLYVALASYPGITQFAVDNLATRLEGFWQAVEIPGCCVHMRFHSYISAPPSFPQDVKSYISVEIPPSKIFTVDPKVSQTD